MKELKKIGFIGVGVMGHGLAKNIARAGFPLVFLEHTGNRSTDDLFELGAKSGDCISDIARNSDAIVMCVTGSSQVEEIVSGDRGILHGMQPGTVVIDCSTVEPHVSQAVAERLQEAGGRFLDAPLTRTPKEAELGTANVMVGGDATVLAMARPVLEAFSENIYHAGPTGAGSTLKLLHNFIALGNCVLLAEAVTTARQNNVDIQTLIEVLTTGGGDSTALKRMCPFITAGDAGGLRFSIANAAKDTGYYRSLVAHLGHPGLAAEAVHRVFQDAAEQDLGDRPVPELIDVLSRSAVRDSRK